MAESPEELNGKVETWRQTLEAHGFRLSRSKTEYMECKFSKRRSTPNLEVKVGDNVIPQYTRFKYLGSIIQEDGEIEGDVNHRIQAGWLKWRKASGVLCDKKVPLELKGKFYRTAVRPAMLYGTECWAVKSQHENKLNVAEMRMLRWMSGKNRKDRIRNDTIRSKTEYMECKFSKRRSTPNLEVKVGDNVIPQYTRFKYLGSIIQEDGEIEGDVNHRIQAGWLKWRKASGVLCDKKVPLELKGKFYRTAVRPAMLYGTECWAVKSQHENKLNVAEMRMLRWMSGKNRKDRIRNDTIREGVEVALITEKMVESRLRWFGHVGRRPVNAVVRRVDYMEGSLIGRGRGRPRKTIGETIKKDLEANGFTIDMIHDRPLWRRLIHVAEPT
ncbi:hypothetical protein LguiA_014639 [Lonicera macranthoides]